LPTRQKPLGHLGGFEALECLARFVWVLGGGGHPETCQDGPCYILDMNTRGPRVLLGLGLQSPSSFVVPMPLVPGIAIARRPHDHSFWR